MKSVRPPVVSVSSICGTNTSSAVPGLRPKSSWKGVMAPMTPGIWPATWLCTGYVTAFCVCTRTATRNLAYPYTFLASGICFASATTSELPLGGHVGSVPKRAGPALGIVGPRVLTFSLPIPLRVRVLATVSSGRRSNTYSARHLSTLPAPSCPPYYPALA